MYAILVSVQFIPYSTTNSDVLHLFKMAPSEKRLKKELI